jgi:hypothetical protein
MFNLQMKISEECFNKHSPKMVGVAPIILFALITLKCQQLKIWNHDYYYKKIICKWITYSLILAWFVKVLLQQLNQKMK